MIVCVIIERGRTDVCVLPREEDCVCSTERGRTDVETLELSPPRREGTRCTKNRGKSTLVKGRGKFRSLRQK